jgi:carboxylate-amine ligase
MGEFKFGLETEYCIWDRENKNALWQDCITFEDLNLILEKATEKVIQSSDFPSLQGLELEPPHRKLMPFVVEGYHLPDMDFQAKDLLPKGVEIRTPVCDSIAQMLSCQAILVKTLSDEMLKKGWAPMALSHHPRATKFSGPQNKRRHDYWQWAMEVMTTYGPDINIGVSEDRMKWIQSQDFLEKLNYYSPALTALTVGAPFTNNELWKIRGQTGKSLRTYRRSIIAPPVELHPHENNRIEFKTFDMSPYAEDFEAMTLMVLTLILDDELDGRASNASRIYDLGRVATEGLHDPAAYERATILLARADRILPNHGFSINALSQFERRLQYKTTLADQWIDLYYEKQRKLESVLDEIARLTMEFLRKKPEPKKQDSFAFVY